MGPENVPVVAIGLDKAINLENKPDELRVTLEHFIVDCRIFHTVVACLSPCKVGLTCNKLIYFLHKLLVILWYLFYLAIW